MDDLKETILGVKGEVRNANLHGFYHPLAPTKRCVVLRQLSAPVSPPAGGITTSCTAT